ncbi:hypothetical protein GmHk_06G017363 [Glycine max]|nr:hypothetical protein GmHk_06G017363 [Glycine max]
MNSIITVLYFNGRVYEDNDGVIFEGSKKAIQIKRGINFNALKKKIGDKVKLQNNEIISAISCRFLVLGKYIALKICDDEDVETMLESFKQQEQMSFLELYIEKDVAGGSMFHSANSLTSCGNYLSNDETQPPTNMSNLHVDEDDDYLVSNSYVEESLDEDDSVDGISDTDDEVTDMIQPIRIVHPAEGAQGIENPFWNDALHYNNINWTYTPCKHIFDQNLEKFRQLSPAIATWIHRISKEKWTMAYDREGRRYGHMTTNLSECINKVLKDCRNIPITALVKSTYSRCRKYFVERGCQAQRQLNEGQWAMKNEAMFPQHHRTNVRSQKYQCDDLQKDTDTSVKDIGKMFLACNTFHDHAPSFVGNILPLQQAPFVCLCLEFQHLTEECETLVLEIHALMLDHVTLAQ